MGKKVKLLNLHMSLIKMLILAENLKWHLASELFIYIYSAVKRLIVINRIQNKRFCLVFSKKSLFSMYI